MLPYVPGIVAMVIMARRATDPKALLVPFRRKRDFINGIDPFRTSRDALFLSIFGAKRTSFLTGRT